MFCLYTYLFIFRTFFLLINDIINNTGNLFSTVILQMCVKEQQQKSKQYEAKKNTLPYHKQQ